MTGRRGSIIVESALTLTLILFVLYGALQIGIVGLEQLTVDGGAFATAHQDSFAGGKQTYVSGKALAQSTLPHLVSPNVNSVTTRGEPPTTAFAGQYGFNTPNARYGGVSMIQPVQTVATVTRNQIANLVLGVTGQTLTVTGIAIEPAFRLINGHADVSGNAFNTAGAFNTNADPLAESAPPFFVGFNYLQSCPYVLAGNEKPWNTCPNGVILSALGSAEFLDAHNWGREVNGVMPSGRAVFWETRYHQKLYANISQKLRLYPNNKADILDQLPRNAALAADVVCVYSFDNINTGSYAPGTTGIGDPLFALHPEGVSPLCPAR